MRTLTTVLEAAVTPLYESLLDDFDTLAAPLSAKAIKEQIKEFLKQTYKNCLCFHSKDSFFVQKRGWKRKS